MEPELSDICATCGHLRGEHLTTAEGEALRCLIEDCRCTMFRTRPKEKEKGQHA
jgi:hypothetical protein